MTSPTSVPAAHSSRWSGGPSASARLFAPPRTVNTWRISPEGVGLKRAGTLVCNLLMLAAIVTVDWEKLSQEAIEAAEAESAGEQKEQEEPAGLTTADRWVGSVLTNPVDEGRRGGILESMAPPGRTSTAHD
jgi:hypothetical protein